MKNGVAVVRRQEVRVDGLLHDRVVDPEQEIDHAAPDQEVARPLPRARQRDARDAEEQVHDVVQDAHLEEPEQLCVGRVPGELHVAVVRGDPGDEPEDPDEQEDDPDEPGRLLKRGAFDHDYLSFVSLMSLPSR
jgi:hypothetical protein